MSTTISDIISQTSASRIYWHDAEQTILVHDVFDRWSWEIACESIGMVNGIIMAHKMPVCTIHQFSPQAAIVPKGLTLTNLRGLMAQDPPNEKLVIFVNAPRLLEIFIQSINRVYSLLRTATKYRYVRSLEEALAIIAQVRDAGQMIA